jgi:glucokinase
MNLKLVAGIDIGGTNTTYGVVDNHGKIYGEGSFPTRKYIDFDLFIQALADGINALASDIHEDYELVGLGLGAPSANYYTGNIEFAPNLVWSGVLPVAQKLKDRFAGLPVVITNDANAAAIGEMIYGGARGMKDFVVVTLGTGLGSGFVVNGELLYGHDGFAGELGHTIVSPNGRECGCGRHGCLETYASASGIVRTVYKLLADHRGDSILKSISFNELSADMITQAAINHDPIAIEAFAHTGKLLGLALANMIAITSPEAIFLFGGLVRAGEHLFIPVKEHMEANLLKFWKGKVALLPSDLNEKTNAAVLGSAALVWKEIKENNNTL